jgi:hypothetical protein
MKTTTAVVAALAMLLAAPARAQIGLFVGAHVTATTLIYKDEGTWDFGPLGSGVHAGLMLGRSIGFFVSSDKNSTSGTLVGDRDLRQWDFLGRLSLIGHGRSRIYLTGGVSGRRSTATLFNGVRGNFDFSGMSPTAGLAAQLLLTSRLALDASQLWTFGKFSDTHGYSASRVEATGSRFSVGASYYVFGGK